MIWLNIAIAGFNILTAVLFCWAIMGNSQQIANLRGRVKELEQDNERFRQQLG